MPLNAWLTSPTLWQTTPQLIVGYNARTKEIYYSDTWGIGHELKKMSLANA